MHLCMCRLFVSCRERRFSQSIQNTCCWCVYICWEVGWDLELSAVLIFVFQGKSKWCERNTRNSNAPYMDLSTYRPARPWIKCTKLFVKAFKTIIIIAMGGFGGTEQREKIFETWRVCAHDAPRGILLQFVLPKAARIDCTCNLRA